MDKLRTIYSFAEGIHELMYDIKQFKDSGKLRKDFRATSWGRVYWNKWINELNMVISFLKGDLNLF